MRLFIVLIFSVCSCNCVQAQKDTVNKIFAFKITGYITPLSDSTLIVQVLKPANIPVNIKEKQFGVLFHCYAPGKNLDTTMIGWGRCQLIKAEYYYFGLTLTKGQRPAEGDLLYITTKFPLAYEGLLFNVMRHAVTLTDVYGEKFMNDNALFTNTKADEIRLLDSMISDIKYTGAEMQKQMPENDQLITDGIFKGKKVFTAMQAATRKDLELFFKYVNVRPKLYGGNTWKISELFATWMTSGTPVPIEP